MVLDLVFDTCASWANGQLRCAKGTVAVAAGSWEGGEGRRLAASAFRAIGCAPKCARRSAHRADMPEAWVGLAGVSRRLYDGDIALIYIMWYGAVRTALESFRNETGNWHILGIPTAMWIGIIGFIVAGAFLVIRHQRGWGTPGAWIDQEPSAPDDDDASRPHATEPSTG